jgi:hypothetical protein
MSVSLSTWSMKVRSAGASFASGCAKSSAIASLAAMTLAKW